MHTIKHGKTVLNTMDPEVLRETQGLITRWMATAHSDEVRTLMFRSTARAIWYAQLEAGLAEWMAQGRLGKAQLPVADDGAAEPAAEPDVA